MLVRSIFHFSVESFSGSLSTRYHTTFARSVLRYIIPRSSINICHLIYEKLCIPANFHKISTMVTFPLSTERKKERNIETLTFFSSVSTFVIRIESDNYSTFHSRLFFVIHSSTLKSAILRLHLFSISIPFEQHYANLHSCFRLECICMYVCTAQSSRHLLLAVVRLLSLDNIAFARRIKSFY
jgi:hypothetical protein